MQSSAAKLLHSVENEISRINVRWFKHLRFSEPLEGMFEQQVGSRRARFHLRAGMLTLFIFDLALLGDWYIIPEHFLVALFVRLFIVTPVVCLLLLAIRSSRNKTQREGSIALLMVTIAIGALCLGFGSQNLLSFRTEPAVLMVLIMLTCVCRVTPSFAIPAVSVVVLINTVMMGSYYHLRQSALTATFTSFSMSSCLMILACYISARSMRISYLLQTRGELQATLLEKSNRDLRRISEHDALTGLSNRYRYERSVNSIFEKARGNGTPLSVVMVDVDYFKAVNDEYGHLYGDRVLERVGSLIQEALRAEDDFAARYGGEEFIVLLPDTDSDAARKVAERIRTLVQVAGSPAVSREINLPQRFTTVSCGVATAIPTQGRSVSELVEAADRALYRAKSEGRNRTCFVEPVLAA